MDDILKPSSVKMGRHGPTLHPYSIMLPLMDRAGPTKERAGGLKREKRKNMSRQKNKNGRPKH